jgi:hypothetical protein
MRIFYRYAVAALAIGALFLGASSPAAAATPAASTGSTAPSAEAVQIWQDLQARYGPATVTTTAAKAEVTAVVGFTDTKGQAHQYTFTRLTSENAGVGTLYDTTWNGWELNRRETLELAVDGANAAVIYAIAALAGCGPCVVGALIEGHWASQANSYYGRGHCAKIYFWLATTEYWGGYCR